MEGLIPLVYKAIKKSRTRGKYECLSSGSAMPFNPADFYISDPAHSITKSNAAEKFHRRSYSSVEDLQVKNGRWAATADGVSPPDTPSDRLLLQGGFRHVGGF
ncbi:hypothetical protein M5689_003930 [Euphorbia peplus]|nr:hypothetical protein M5689_003930 [Euphorbia peplus]